MNEVLTGTAEITQSVAHSIAREEVMKAKGELTALKQESKNMEDVMLEEIQKLSEDNARKMDDFERIKEEEMAILEERTRNDMKEHLIRDTLELKDSFEQEWKEKELTLCKGYEEKIEGLLAVSNQRTEAIIESHREELEAVKQEAANQFREMKLAHEREKEDVRKSLTSMFDAEREIYAQREEKEKKEKLKLERDLKTNELDYEEKVVELEKDKAMVMEMYAVQEEKSRDEREHLTKAIEVQEREKRETLHEKMRAEKTVSTLKMDLAQAILKGEDEHLMYRSAEAALQEQLIDLRKKMIRSEIEAHTPARNTARPSSVQAAALRSVGTVAPSRSMSSAGTPSASVSQANARRIFSQTAAVGERPMSATGSVSSRVSRSQLAGARASSSLVRGRDSQAL